MTTPKPYPEAEPVSAIQPNKVAETVAASYLTRTEIERGTYYRQPAPRFIAGLPASDDVWNFAQEYALAPHIETAVRLAREHFKKIREINLDYMVDPEIPNHSDLLINLHVTGTFDELINADNAYIRAINRAIPDDVHDKMCPLLWGEAIDLKENSIA